MDPSLAGMLRRADPDRFFTALFAPASHRETLLTLYAFNHELARAREVTREPGLALIRLQWWREVVEGAAYAHAVATPLHAALSGGRLHAPDLLAMIEAREIEVERAFMAASDWQEWLMQGAGSLAVAAGRALGAPGEALDRLRSYGAGYGLAGQLRSIAAFARQGRCLLPAEILARHGLNGNDVLANPDAPGMDAVRADLAKRGTVMLGQAQECSAAWIAAALPAVLGRRDLARMARLGMARLARLHVVRPRSVADRAAIVSAFLRHRA